MSFLSELNKDIVDTHKNLADLNQTLAMSLQDSKKWNIASRLLSGTGLWSVQNRIRAVISIVGEYNRATIQQLENAQKNADLLEKLGKRTENLEKATKNFNASTLTDMATLESARNTEMDLLEAAQKRKAEMHNYTRNEMKAELTALGIAHKGNEKKAQLEKKLNAANYDEIVKRNTALDKNKELLEDLTPILKERQQLMDNYKLDDAEANQIMEHRLRLMDETSKKQDLILKGSEKARELEGKMLIQQAIQKDPTATKEQKRAAERQEGVLKFQRHAQKFRDFSERVLKTAWKVFKFALKSIFLYTPIFILIAFFLYHTVKRAWPTMKAWWNNTESTFGKMKEWAFNLQPHFEKIGEAWTSIKEAWANGDIASLLYNVGKTLWHIASIAFKIWVGIIITGIAFWSSFLWGAITGGFDEADGAANKALLVGGNLLQTVGAIGMLIAGISVVFFSGSWIPLLIAAGVGALGSWLKSLVDFKANGGISRGGLTVVGERGPELLNLPRGSRVHSNAESRRMGGNTINVHVNGRLGASDSEIRDIARKVGAQINREINRTTSSGTRM